MAEPISVSAPVTGDSEKVFTLETGKLARQADGAVIGRIGGTYVLVAATAAKTVREGIDFFPLTVDVEERLYAAGKIPGSFFRREGRAPDSAILTCRLTDRPLRPNFPDGFRNEVHIVATVMGADKVNPHDVLIINCASAALLMSGIPFLSAIGAVRLAYTADGQWLAHPSYQEGDESSFEVVVAGRELDNGDVAIMMVEAGGTTSTWDNVEGGGPKVTEEALAEGLEAAKVHIKDMIKLQLDLVAAAGGPKPTMAYNEQLDYSPEIFAAVEAAGAAKLQPVIQIAKKAERDSAESEVRASIVAEVLPQFAGTPDAEKQIKAATRSLVKKLVRSRIVNEGTRIDGRGPRDLRPLAAQVAVLPTVHGSGFFERGETHVVNITTLGVARMDQMIDGIDTTERKRYMHHYNMPPFSTGETGFMRGPKRREIGHGLLAERALLPVIPKIDEFPYTLRLVSEVLSSNGSTSMASVCGSTLSLMDAGVPIKAPVAGIAMGLVYADGKYTTLTDILGAEDAYGDMDFKVAGTAEFVTALQLDTKIDGIPADVLAAALAQAKEARLQILEVMQGAIAQPRAEVGATSPKIISFTIPMDKIGEVIGPKGKVINSIQSETGAGLTVDDDGFEGTVTISAVDIGSLREAERQVRLILEPPTAEVGATYPGRVVNITKFGAFVNILPGRDGLVHISKLGGGRRINNVEDVLTLGEELEVVVEDIDPNGKISLRPTNVPERAEGAGDGGSPAAGDSEDGSREYVSFEDSFESELREEFGDLGPAPVGGAPGGDRERSDRGGRSGGGDRGDRGRRPRRRTR
ncbi:MAG: polyribonucleotide nucleotidyltransferase [Acidimicrobiales bacterium]|nr:polyribonucleotide nucleotidyltransferase [Acidimicrobiales bacterium]